jgi:hypothetical protein
VGSSLIGLTCERGHQRLTLVASRLFGIVGVVFWPARRMIL